MKWILRYLLISLLLSLYLNASTFKVTTDEWYPYTSKEHNGFIEQIVTEVLDVSNIKYTIDYTNFEQGYKDTLNNTYDGTFPYFVTKDREKSVLYSDPLFEAENVLFYNKDRFKNDVKNIYTYRIGLVKGYAYKNIDINKFKNIVYLDNDLVGFDMLYKGKIDLLPSNKLVAIHIIKKYFNDFYSNMDYLKDERFISKDFLYLIYNKNEENKGVLKTFNASLKKLKKSGKYKQIILENRQLINAKLSNVIKLVNNTESFPMVVATDSPNAKEKYMIPRGTKAIVLEWSKHFKEKGSLKIYDEMFKKTKVRIVNGPLKGKILYVENMYIEIE